MIHLVFDVESVGLHGDGFAVGWVVLDTSRDSSEIEYGRIWTAPENCRGPAGGLEWVQKNVRGCAYDAAIVGNKPTHPTLFELRNFFWERVWTPRKMQGAHLWADVAWPVEARFLAACVDDCHQKREWQGPFPLLDVSTLYEGLGKVRRPRRIAGDEGPEHDPLADARYSGNLLLEALAPAGTPS